MKKIYYLRSLVAVLLLTVTSLLSGVYAQDSETITIDTWAKANGISMDETPITSVIKGEYTTIKGVEFNNSTSLEAWGGTYFIKFDAGGAIEITSRRTITSIDFLYGGTKAGNKEGYVVFTTADGTTIPGTIGVLENYYAAGFTPSQNIAQGTTFRLTCPKIYGSDKPLFAGFTFNYLAGEEPLPEGPTAEPVLTVTTSNTDIFDETTNTFSFEDVVKGTKQEIKLQVKATDLTSDITLSSESDFISFNPATISKDDTYLTGDNGRYVTVSFIVPAEAGSAKFTVSTEGAEAIEYNVNYTLNANAEAVVIGDFIAKNNISATEQPMTSVIDLGSTKVTNAGENGTYKLALNTSGAGTVRVYKDNILGIKSETKKIKSIEFTFVSAKNSLTDRGATLNVEGTYSLNTETKVGTFTPTNAVDENTQITVTCTQGTNFQITQIVVYYATPALFPEGQVLYLKPTEIWNNSGAWFAAYFWGDGNDNSAWAKYELVAGSDNVYKVTVPAGDTYHSVIFTRMNASSTELSWDYKWNQTGDLTWWNGTSNCYTITNMGELGEKSTGEWSVYTEPVSDPRLVVTGDDFVEGEHEDLFGATVPAGTLTFVEGQTETTLNIKAKDFAAVYAYVGSEESLDNVIQFNEMSFTEFVEVDFSNEINSESGYNLTLSVENAAKLNGIKLVVSANAEDGTYSMVVNIVAPEVEGADPMIAISGDGFTAGEPTEFMPGMTAQTGILKFTEGQTEAVINLKALNMGQLFQTGFSYNENSNDVITLNDMTIGNFEDENMAVAMASENGYNVTVKVTDASQLNGYDFLIMAMDVSYNRAYAVVTIEAPVTEQPAESDFIITSMTNSFTDLGNNQGQIEFKEGDESVAVNIKANGFTASYAYLDYGENTDNVIKVNGSDISGVDGFQNDLNGNGFDAIISVADASQLNGYSFYLMVTDSEENTKAYTFTIKAPAVEVPETVVTITGENFSDNTMSFGTVKVGETTTATFNVKVENIPTADLIFEFAGINGALSTRGFSTTAFTNAELAAGKDITFTVEGLANKVGENKEQICLYETENYEAIWTGYASWTVDAGISVTVENAEALKVTEPIIVGEGPKEITIKVTATGLTENLTIACNPEKANSYGNRNITITPSEITPEEAAAGKDVVIAIADKLIPSSDSDFDGDAVIEFKHMGAVIKSVKAEWTVEDHTPSLTVKGNFGYNLEVTAGGEPITGKTITVTAANLTENIVVTSPYEWITCDPAVISENLNGVHTINVSIAPDATVEAKEYSNILIEVKSGELVKTAKIQSITVKPGETPVPEKFTVSGKVIDEAGAAIEGVAVAATFPMGTDGKYETATTDAEGKYSFEFAVPTSDLKMGNITFTKAGYVGASKVINYTDGDIEVGDIVLKAETVEPATPVITIDNATVTVAGEFEAGADVEATFTVKAADLTNAITFAAEGVTFDPATIAADAEGLATGVAVKATFKAAATEGENTLTITVASEGADSKTVTVKYTVKKAVEPAVDDVVMNANVWSADGMLFIESDVQATATVYTVAGQAVRTLVLSEGVNAVELPTAMYVVKVNDSIVKIAVK